MGDQLVSEGQRGSGCMAWPARWDRWALGHRGWALRRTAWHSGMLIGDGDDEVEAGQCEAGTNHTPSRRHLSDIASPTGSS